MSLCDYEIHPAAQCFPTHDPARLDELANDIRSHGLIEPITLCDGKVLDGRNRLKACKAAGVDPRFEDFDGDPVAYVRSKNIMRRDLTTDQRRACLVDLEDLDTERRGGDRTKPASVAVLPSDSIAAAMHEGKRTAEKAITVKKKAPDLHEAVKAGKLSHNLASKLIDAPEKDQLEVLRKIDEGTHPVQAMRLAKRERLAEASLDLPDGIYRVIYADPPWHYGDTKILAGTSYARLAAQNHYPTMPTPNICALSVQDMAAHDAVLFMWSTSPLLPDALEVIEAWGFTYKTHFIWDKVRHNVGNYHGCNHELLLVATRGSCVPETDRRLDSVQVHERNGGHSEKPEHFRELIDTLYPTGPRVELFARGEAPEGWNTWGNEAEAAQ